MSEMLQEYLNIGHSPYHVVKMASDRLCEAGFRHVSQEDIRNLPEGNYWLTVGDTTLFAFKIPAVKSGELRIAAAHTDYPCFKVKPDADMSPCGNCRRINVEPYGGMLRRTWFDRPLGIAGAVWLSGEDPFNPVMKIIDINRPVCLIPSLAPHMDREIENKAIDVQKEMLPVTGLTGSKSLAEIIGEEAGCSTEDILSYDLNLYVYSNALEAGSGGRLIMGQGIDNIASAAALTEAFLNGEAKDGAVSMICLFDNEEIGSRTRQSADSAVLAKVIEQLGTGTEKGFILSADGAHGVHPNYPEKADPTAAAEVGKGLVIKTSASRRYATEGRMIAVIRSICHANDIPYQIQANRSGNPGGSTIGPIISSHVPMAAADIGIPMLAMHSACECAALSDYDSLVELIRVML